VYRALISHSHPVITVISSWLGGVQLADSLPIVAGKVAFDDTAVVKRRLSLTVPARTPDRRWDPAGDPTAPLGAYGQRLHVYSGVGLPGGTVELLDLGWYLITGWKRSEESATVTVEALDLARLLVDDRLPAPESPPAGATFTSEFRRLVEPILPVSIPAGFPDRAMSGTIVWDRDRDKALANLCAAWPARWYVDDTGTARVAAPYTAVSDATPPDLVLTDGQAGTVVARARQGDRGAMYNRIVVDGKAADDTSAPPHAVAEITAAGSPIRATGPYGRVTRFYTSDLLTTQAQADAAAASMLITYSSVGRSEPVKAVPDPAVQLGDVARVYTRDGDRYTARVDHLTLPLTPADGAMDLSLGMLPAGVV
jgi:hypothetical protein